MLSAVLNNIKPVDDIWRPVNQFKEEIADELKKHNITATPQVGGSIAKDTWLRGDFDCDMFIRFDRAYKDQDISDLLETALKPFGSDRVHGSRDYFQVQRNNIKFEIIPVIAIERPEDALNVTDVSPLHVEWVKKHGMCDEIRLTKAFCKANRVYGAESYIGGFSGHVLDIITIHYGGFMKLLRASKSWKDGQLIDINDAWKNDVSKLNKSKIGPLIVIDPIQPDRNAAAALTKEKIEGFISAAKDFLQEPSTDFFVKEEFSTKKISETYHRKDCIFIEADPVEGKKDIIGAKLMKSFEYIKTQLSLNNFKTIDSGWDWEEGKKATFWLIFEDTPLPKIMEKSGPPIKNQKDADRFREKHKETYIRDDKLYTTIETRYRKPIDLIKILLMDEYIKERTSSASLSN